MLPSASLACLDPSKLDTSALRNPLSSEPPCEISVKGESPAAKTPVLILDQIAGSPNPRPLLLGEHIAESLKFLGLVCHERHETSNHLSEVGKEVGKQEPRRQFGQKDQ
jgi:hypothetical protein